MAWLPKATVQAAVGGTALDLVLDHGLGDDARTHAETVLTLSVLVISHPPPNTNLPLALTRALSLTLTLTPTLTLTLTLTLALAPTRSS